MKYKVKRKKSVREQRSRKSIVIFYCNSKKERNRLMDVIPICHEIPSNKRKVFDEIMEVFKFLNLQKEGILEDKSRAFTEKGKDNVIWGFNSILSFIQLLKECVDRKELTAGTRTTTQELGKGTGLGLSISHRIIVETHKGDIRFNSKPGKTSFQVRLPIIYKGIEQRYWSWIKP